MLTKFLFTIAVIVALIMLARYRKEQEADTSSLPAEKIVKAIPFKASQTTEEDPQIPLFSPDKKQIWLIALVLSGLTIILSSYFMFSQWQESREIIDIKIINIENNVQTYQAYRKDIEKNHFITLDGTEIRPSERDRIELKPVK